MSLQKVCSSLPSIPLLSLSELWNKTIFELEEMLAREKTLLGNRFFIQKLPDKGAKIKNKIEKIEQELKCKKQLLSEDSDIKMKHTEVDDLEWGLRNLSLKQPSPMKPKFVPNKLKAPDLGSPRVSSPRRDGACSSPVPLSTYSSSVDSPTGSTKHRKWDDSLVNPNLVFDTIKIINPIPNIIAEPDLEVESQSLEHIL